MRGGILTCKHAHACTTGTRPQPDLYCSWLGRDVGSGRGKYRSPNRVRTSRVASCTHTHTHLSKRLRPACINPPRHVVPGATSRAGSRMLSYPVVVASLPRISAAHWQPRTRASTGTRTCTNAGTHTRTRTRENTRAHVFLCGKVKRQLLCASMRPEPGRLHPSPSYIILRLIQSTAICSA